MLTIPSNSGLKAFEAAARHLSFNHASEELGVTPGAVSRQIQSLEHYLGKTLFHRHHKKSGTNSRRASVSGGDLTAS